MPPAAHPRVNDLGQAILFEPEAKFDRMQTFLDGRKEELTAGVTRIAKRAGRSM